MKNYFLAKPFDIVIFVICFFLVVLSFSSLRTKTGDDLFLYISTPNACYIYSLKKDETYNIQGALGISVIEVKDGKASFSSSPCPQKTCVSCPAIDKNNEWTACLPNKVFIRVQGKNQKTSIDAESF